MTQSTNPYASDRLIDLDFDPAKHFGILDTYSGETTAKVVKMERMYGDEEGNLCIRITDLDNRFIPTNPEKSFSKQSRQIITIRRLANPNGKGKYDSLYPGNGVFPCFFNNTLDAYNKKKKIKTLILTEGYIKGFVMDCNLIYNVALPGITVWREKNQTEIFGSILKLVEQCQVENLVWLTDGDTMKMEWEENKDLLLRPQNFYTSVKIFKDKTLDWNRNQFWYHIKEDCQYKGIDDLIKGIPDKIRSIKSELEKPSSSDCTFFKRFNVGALSFDKIKEYFGINKGAEGFYSKYESVIGLRPFIYGKGLYRYSDDERKLVYERAGESAQFAMVDSTYYIKGALPSLSNVLEGVIKPIKPIGIKKMFQHKCEAEVQKIMYDIPHYNAFINRPEHINYKDTYEVKTEEGFNYRFLNKYQRISHNPRPGEFPVTMNFIKHIFGTGSVDYDGTTYSETDLGLDYLQLLYCNPTQKLPILALVSEEGSTGKTKFWEWIGKIFQQNVKEISSDQLTGNFTSYFATMLLCYIDEAFIDKTHTVEKLKSLVTASKSRLEEKFTNAETIDNFLKIGLSSNNVNNFASIRSQEMRFWIRLIPKIQKEDYLPNFEELIENEIPAFLFFLQQRKMVTERQSRLWFANPLIQTETLLAVKRDSRSSVEIMVEMVMREYHNNCLKTIVQLSPKDIKTLLDENSLTLAKIRWALQKFKIEISSHSNPYVFYSIGTDFVTAKDAIIEEKRKSATYTISADKFFTPEELVSIFDDEQLVLLESFQIKHHGEETWFQMLQERSILNPDKSSHMEDLLNKADSFKTFLELRDKLPF